MVDAERDGAGGQEGGPAGENVDGGGGIHQPGRFMRRRTAAATGRG
jgi:hypothetical protein